MKNEVLNTPFFSATMRQDGIVRITWISTVEVTLSVAEECKAAIEDISQGQIRPLLVDIRVSKGVNREARAYMAGPMMDVVGAVALFVDSPVSQLLANFFLRINKPTIPTKMFTSETEALKWLQTIA